MKLIVYTNEFGILSTCFPSPEALLYATIEEIAIKDVPANIPFKIIDESELPPDFTFRDAWEWGFDSEDGVGGESYEFSQDVLDKIKGVVK